MELQKDGTSKYLVDSIWFNSANGDELVKVQYDRDDNRKRMYYLSEYQGDRSDCWIIVEEDKKEIARHNVRFVATINWSKRLKA